MRRYGAMWCLGVVMSFALPAVPAAVWWAGAMVLLAIIAVRWPYLRPLMALPVGAAYAVWQVHTALAAQWPLQQAGQQSLAVRVADLPQMDGRRVVFHADAWTADGRYYRLRLADYQRRDWPAGSYWRVSARLRPLVGEWNVRGFNREAWALANGLAGGGTLGRVRAPWVPVRRQYWADGLLAVRASVSGRWQNLAGQGADGGVALMRALSVGEQGALSDEMWGVFRPLGLNHLVSISGLHVSMVAFAVMGLARMVLRFMSYMPRRPRWWMLAAGLVAAWMYAALAGFAVPTVRAAVMFSVMAVAWMRGGWAGAWTAWWLALVVVLSVWPTAVLAAGSWLSFGLVAALLWAGSWLTGNGRVGLLQAQAAVVGLSVVMLGYGFAVLPVLSVPVNLLAIPWFSWVLVPLSLSAVLLPWPWWQHLAVWLAEYSWRVLAAVADYAPEWTVALAPWPLLAAACVAVAVLLVPAGLGWRGWAAAMLLLFVFYRPPRPQPGHLRVVVLDSGQGLAVWLQTQNRDMLFDTGTAAAAQGQVIPALRAFGVSRLDALVLSHQDADHDGGETAVRRAFSPHTVWAGQPYFYRLAQHCSQQSWDWDGVHFEWLTTDVTAGGDNDKSCVLRAVAGGEAVLITGDLGQQGEKQLVWEYGPRLYSQLLILGHHGSNTASAGVFLNQVAADYAVASSGYGNSYGHPALPVQNRLRAHGIRLWRTDLSGAVCFELGQGVLLPQRMARHVPYWQKKPFAAE